MLQRAYPWRARLPSTCSRVPDKGSLLTYTQTYIHSLETMSNTAYVTVSPYDTVCILYIHMFMHIDRDIM